jgi:ubiquinone/menaquinone biosynthesis C-methylase UbiE
VIPFENERFDSILSTEVLEHVFNIDELLQEFNRVLKKGNNNNPFTWEEHEMPYDFARYTPALQFLYQNMVLELLKILKQGIILKSFFNFS